MKKIILKHYLWNCLHFFTTESKRESHEKFREIKYFRNVVMPSIETKILEFNQYQKSCKAPFTMYGDVKFFNRLD